MLIRFSIICFVFVFSLSACRKDNNTSAQELFTVTYEIGSSWVNSSYKASINDEGVFTVTEISLTDDNTKESIYKLKSSDLVLIKEKIQDVSTVDLEDSYGFGDNKPTDLPVRLFKYSYGNKMDSTSIYYPEENELPAELEAILSAINNIIITTDTLGNSK